MQKKQYLFREEGAWALSHLSLGSRGASAWNQFVERLFAAFERAFSHEVDIVVHKLDNMRNRTYERVGNRRTISIDPCVPGQINIGTSRIFLPGGIQDLGVGARPGFKALEEQVKHIPPGEYVLLEDDIFSGGTIAQILRFLETHGICVTEIITGMQVGTPNLTVRVTPIERYNKEEVVDLNDPRDFLAGSHCGGLVIRHHDGNLSRAPYVLPFVDTAERSSIPRSEVLSISQEIWKLNVKFWARFPDVVLADADPFFRVAVSRWGHIGTESMASVCEDMMRLLDDCRSTVTPLPWQNASKGVVFLDLNDALIADREASITVPASHLEKAIRETEERGWTVGLCSDSPHGALKGWGKKHGVNGPIISENGAMVCEVPLTSWDPNVVRSLVKEWMKEHSVRYLGETLAKEFGGKLPKGPGIAFGAGRSRSFSVFCLGAESKPDPETARELGEWLTKRFGKTVDVSPRVGWIAVHGADDFRRQKGKTLRGIGWSLYQEGRRCVMVGNSISDLVYAPALCLSIHVGNSSAESQRATDHLVEGSYTEGVIEALDRITKEF